MADNTFTIARLIHILRNPYGHSQEEIKTARLAAADLLDTKNDCLITPFSSSICIHDTFGCKVDHEAMPKMPPNSNAA